MSSKPTKETIMRGYLEKKSPKSVLGVHAWQRRYFELVLLTSAERGHEISMYYFKTEQDATEHKEPLGEIVLNDIQAVLQMKDKPGRFDVQVPSRVFALKCADPVDQRKWVQSLQTMSHMNDYQKPSHLPDSPAETMKLMASSSSARRSEAGQQGSAAGGTSAADQNKSKFHDASETIDLMTRGSAFIKYNYNPTTGQTTRDIVLVFYKKDSTSLGSLYYCEPGEKVEDSVNALALHTLTDMYLGRQSKAFRSTIASHASSDKCFTALGATSAGVQAEFNLEGDSKEQVAAWLYGLNAILTHKGGRKVMTAEDSEKEEQKKKAAAAAKLKAEEEKKAQAAAAVVKAEEDAAAQTAAAAATAAAATETAAATAAAEPAKAVEPTAATETTVAAPVPVEQKPAEPTPSASTAAATPAPLATPSTPKTVPAATPKSESPWKLKPVAAAATTPETAATPAAAAPVAEEKKPEAAATETAAPATPAKPLSIPTTTSSTSDQQPASPAAASPSSPMIQPGPGEPVIVEFHPLNAPDEPASQTNGALAVTPLLKSPKSGGRSTNDGTLDEDRSDSVLLDTPSQANGHTKGGNTSVDLSNQPPSSPSSAQQTSQSASNRPQFSYGPDETVFTWLAWLGDIYTQEYSSLFASHGIDLEFLCVLTINDLSVLGIRNPVHLKKMAHGIEKLKECGTYLSTVPKYAASTLPTEHKPIDPATLSEVGQFLYKLGPAFLHYSRVFEENGVDVVFLMTLQDDDLEELGVTRLHRKKLLGEIKTLREHTRKSVVMRGPATVPPTATAATTAAATPAAATTTVAAAAAPAKETAPAAAAPATPAVAASTPEKQPASAATPAGVAAPAAAATPTVTVAASSAAPIETTPATAASTTAATPAAAATTTSTAPASAQSTAPSTPVLSAANNRAATAANTTAPATPSNANTSSSSAASSVASPSTQGGYLARAQEKKKLEEKKKDSTTVTSSNTQMETIIAAIKDAKARRAEAAAANALAAVQKRSNEEEDGVDLSGTSIAAIARRMAQQREEREKRLRTKSMIAAKETKSLVTPAASAPAQNGTDAAAASSSSSAPAPAASSSSSAAPAATPESSSQ